VAQDSSRPDFWDTRYRGGVTPWDAAGVPPALEAWIAEKHAPLRILVPGCGTGYEVRLFATHGHDVLAIDFSDAAIEAARRELGALGERVVKADFFAFESAAFDLVYERAFLCALPRAMWQAWARRMAQLVRPGGELAGFFFFDDSLKGPPFGAGIHEIDTLLQPHFNQAENAAIPAEHSLAVFKGKERWQVWKRRL
jgi:SAM-dependent methyltransferase